MEAVMTTNRRTTHSSKKQSLVDKTPSQEAIYLEEHYGKLGI